MVGSGQALRTTPASGRTIYVRVIESGVRRIGASPISCQNEWRTRSAPRSTDLVPRTKNPHPPDRSCMPMALNRTRRRPSDARSDIWRNVRLESSVTAGSLKCAVFNQENAVCSATSAQLVGDHTHSRPPPLVTSQIKKKSAPRDLAIRSHCPRD